MRTSTLLRRANPLPDPDRHLTPRGRAQLRALVGADEPTPLTRPTPTVAPWSRWVTVTAAIALAVGLLLVPGLGASGGATAQAKGLLDKAIVAAVDPPTRPDQYWRITTTSITSDIIGEGMWGDDDTISMLRHEQRIAYVAVDGSRPTWYVDRTGPYLRQVSGPPTALPTADWRTSEVWTTNLSEREQDYLGILDLPTDPSLLRLALYRLGHDRGASDDEEILSLTAEILQRGYAPAALRAALFEVLKTVPGVDIVDNNLTLDGRTGIALGRAEPNRDGARHELIFDASTAEYIGERSIWTSPDATFESATSRELVNEVDPEVTRTAHHYQCDVGAGGMVTCPAR